VRRVEEHEVGLDFEGVLVSVSNKQAVTDKRKGRRRRGKIRTENLAFKVPPRAPRVLNRQRVEDAYTTVSQSEPSPSPPPPPTQHLNHPR
jgi:hypothetical protein